LIEVEYDELPRVTNIEEATAPGAVQVHEGDVARAELRGSTYGAPPRFNGTNICYYLTLGREDPEKGFAKADFVFEDTFRFQKVQHYSLEAHNNIAYYDGEKLTARPLVGNLSLAAEPGAGHRSVRRRWIRRKTLR
jgi:CO/xanthine dehydrogenase Mo-binding subunit